MDSSQVEGGVPKTAIEPATAESSLSHQSTSPEILDPNKLNHNEEQSLTEFLLKEISIDESSAINIAREEERYSPLSLQHDPEVGTISLSHAQNSDKTARKGFCIQHYMSKEELQAAKHLQRVLKQSKEAAKIKKEKPLWKVADPQKSSVVRETRVHPFISGVGPNSLTHSFLLPPMLSSSSSHVVSCCAFQLDKFSVSPYPQASISSLSKRCGFSVNKMTQEGSLTLARAPVTRTPLSCVLTKSASPQRPKRRVEAKAVSEVPKHHLYNTRSMSTPSLSPSTPISHETNSPFHLSVSSESSKEDDTSDEPLKNALLSLRAGQSTSQSEEVSHNTLKDTSMLLVDPELLVDVCTPSIDHNEICQNETSSDVISYSSTPCNCKRSRCLKLYCECFASDRYCHGCHCQSCMNTPEHFYFRQEARALILSKNPDAFRVHQINGTVTISKGCNCKKNNCLKGYCDCFLAGLDCGVNCHCLDCKNHPNCPEQQLAKKRVDRRRRLQT